MNNDIKIIIDEPNNPIKINMSDKLNIIRLTDYHNELQNLDYEHSGHTGFASQKELSILEQKVVPRDFSTLSILSNDFDKSEAYVYVDYNNTSNKVSISNIVDKKIRTVEEVPSDWKINEYIFEEIK